MAPPVFFMIIASNLMKNNLKKYFFEKNVKSV